LKHYEIYCINTHHLRELKLLNRTVLNILVKPTIEKIILIVAEGFTIVGVHGVALKFKKQSQKWMNQFREFAKKN